MVDCSAHPVRPKARCTAGSTRIVTLLCAMVLAPQRMPNRASSTFSTGRWRTVFWGMVTCSRRGAKKQCRRKYSPRARSEEHTSELQSRRDLVCRLLLEKKKKKKRSERAERQERD